MPRGDVGTGVKAGKGRYVGGGSGEDGEQSGGRARENGWAQVEIPWCMRSVRMNGRVRMGGSEGVSGEADGEDIYW